MSYSTPVPPFTLTPASVEGNAVFLIVDGHDTIVATAFDQSSAEFFVNRLNNTGRINPLSFNPYIASMLAAFRLHLEHELGEQLIDQPLPIGDLLGDLAHWFSLCTGERAMALGPDLLVYLARQNGLLTDQMVTVEFAGPTEFAGPIERAHDPIRIIALDPVTA